MGRPLLLNPKVLSDEERVEYHRELYRKSAKHRLARINHTRRRQGYPEAKSLDECKLRIPLEIG